MPALGSIFKKITGKKQISPEMRKVYKSARAAEIREIKKQRKQSQVDKIKAKARRDARIAATPKKQRAMKQLKDYGTKVQKRVKKFDSERFEANVMGLSTSGPPRKKRGSRSW